MRMGAAGRLVQALPDGRCVRGRARGRASGRTAPPKPALIADHVVQVHSHDEEADPQDDEHRVDGVEGHHALEADVPVGVGGRRVVVVPHWAAARARAYTHTHTHTHMHTRAGARNTRSRRPQRCIACGPCPAPSNALVAVCEAVGLHKGAPPGIVRDILAVNVALLPAEPCSRCQQRKRPQCEQRWRWPSVLAPFSPHGGAHLAHLRARAHAHTHLAACPTWPAPGPQSP